MTRFIGGCCLGDPPPPSQHPRLPTRPSSPPHSLLLIVMSRASCAFSNRSDEDDLPPELAEAVGVTTTTTTTTTTAAAATQVSAPLASPKVHKVSSPQNSEGKSPLSPGAKVWGKASCTRWGSDRNEVRGIRVHFSVASPTLVNVLHL